MQGIRLKPIKTNSIVYLAEKHTLFILTCMYGLCVAVLLALNHHNFFPLLLPDEGQYALTGYNLFRHGTFSLRGDFPTVIQPLYPLVLGAAFALPEIKGLGSNVFLLNHVIMAAVIFPAYALARLLNLSKSSSLMVAFASVCVPSMYYASHYMSEVIYYPLFVLLCYLGGVYFAHPQKGAAAAVGIAMGAALLLKSSSLAFCLTWLSTNFLALVVNTGNRPRKERLRNHIWLPLFAFGIAFFCVVPWLLVKGMHFGFSINGLIGGAYASGVKKAAGFGNIIRWWPLYGADIFLLTGFISLTPFLSAMWRLLRGDAAERLQSLFWLLLFTSVSLMAATFSGVNTGELRERHLFLIIPLILSLSARGMKDEGRRPLVLMGISASLSLLLVLIISKYHFVNWWQLFDAAWIPSAGLFVKRVFSMPQLSLDMAFLIFAVILVLCIQFVWIVTPARRTNAFLCVCILLFSAYSLKASNLYDSFTRYEREAGRGALYNWLLTQIGPGRRVVVGGRRAAFQPPSALREDEEWTEWSDVFGPDRWSLFVAEAAGLYDVRMAVSESQLREYISLHTAPYLLASADISGLPVLSNFGSVRLYALENDSGGMVQNVAVRYIASFGAEQFKSDTGRLLLNDGKWEWISEDAGKGYFVRGMEKVLPAGRYRVIFRVRSPRGGLVTVEAYDRDHRSLISSRTVPFTSGTSPFADMFIQSDGRRRCEFRALLEKGTATFGGVTIEKLSNPVAPRKTRSHDD